MRPARQAFRAQRRALVVLQATCVQRSRAAATICCYARHWLLRLRWRLAAATCIQAISFMQQRMRCALGPGAFHPSV